MGSINTRMRGKENESNRSSMRQSSLSVKGQSLKPKVNPKHGSHKNSYDRSALISPSAPRKISSSKQQQEKRLSCCSGNKDDGSLQDLDTYVESKQDIIFREPECQSRMTEVEITQLQQCEQPLQPSGQQSFDVLSNKEQQEEEPIRPERRKRSKKVSVKNHCSFDEKDKTNGPSALPLNASTNGPSSRLKKTSKPLEPSNSPFVMPVAKKKKKKSRSRYYSRSTRAGVVSWTEEREDQVVLSNMRNLPPPNSAEAIRLSAIRLKCILAKLKTDNWVRADVIKNIEYAANVLRRSYRKESERLMNEEEELRQSVDMQPAVPGVVKEWLTATFTQSMTMMSRKSQDRIKFRSVATAIRAGIMVDRLHRRLSSAAGLRTPANVLQLLESMNSWSFDIFRVNEVGEGHALKHIGYELLQKYDIISKYKMSSLTLDNFLTRLEQGYSKHKNPYHCLIHAADVTQTIHAIISDNQLSTWMTDLEVFAILVSSMIHDFEHTGTTNMFHINTGSDMALLYNDKAVLENHHVSSVFRFMRDGNTNILSNLTTQEHKYFRSLVIEIVMCTDMSYHFQMIKNLKTMLAANTDSIDKHKALSMMVHCADISHPSKSWHLHKHWTILLAEEFFKQGDREKEMGLPVSPLCDRETTVIPQSQIGFIDFIVEPSFQVLSEMLEHIAEETQQLQEQQKQQQNNNGTEKNNGTDNQTDKQTDKQGSLQTSRDSNLTSTSSSSSISSVFSSSDSKSKAKLKSKEVKTPWNEFFELNKQKWRETSEEEIKEILDKREAKRLEEGTLQKSQSKEKTDDEDTSSYLELPAVTKPLDDEDKNTEPQQQGSSTPLCSPPGRQSPRNFETISNRSSKAGLLDHDSLLDRSKRLEETVRKGGKKKLSSAVLSLNSEGVEARDRSSDSESWSEEILQYTSAEEQDDEGLKDRNDQSNC